MKGFGLSISLSLIFLIVSVVAMRRHHLRERTALLWLFVSVVMVGLSLVLPTRLLDHFSPILGIAYPPALILLLAVFFLMGLVFYLSLSFDRLAARQTMLIQELGLLMAKEPTEEDGNAVGEE